MPSVDSTTWLGARTLLAFRTGRFDLVGVSGGSPDYTTDNGADFFLKKAIRWWDREIKHARKQKVEYVTLAAGDVSIEVSAYAVLSVRPTTLQQALIQANEEWLREQYSGDLTAVAADSYSLYWAHKTQEADSLVKEVWILPPTGADQSIEVKGYFYTPITTDDDDTNYWLTYFDEAVLYVAMQMVNDMDLNPFTNSTLKSLRDSVERHILSEVIAEEIEFYGTERAG